MRPSLRLFAALILTPLAALAGASVHAQTWPARPVHVVSPFPAAGPSDTAARLIAPKLQETLGQPVVLENRPRDAESRVVHKHIDPAEFAKGGIDHLGNVHTQSLRTAPGQYNSGFALAPCERTSRPLWR